ncbi:MFS transporter [Jannaschia sp. Os4]|nr:MFS transporter [Jannaschia sp. Os4]MBM2577534.1 MFS transporter [Jannaschia sp. Os4]
MAMTAATIAFSIDAMLPALPRMGADLSPADPERAQLVVLAFVIGTGLGTFVAGPLSDAFGRKPVMIGGAVIYSLSAAAATWLDTLDGVLVARVVQGIGASGPRVVAMAMIRDLYMGRGMARILSLTMTVFTLVPAIAPLIGAGIIAVSGWQGVFWAFVVFSAATSLWLGLRQPETLPPTRRRPLDLAKMRAAVAEVLRHAVVRRAMLVQTLVFGILFSTIASVQSIYAATFDAAETFPLWFGGVALVSGSVALLNASIVERLGMVPIIRVGVCAHLLLSVALLAGWSALPEATRFPSYLVWQFASFALAGLAIGNLNAIAMAPMGHLAGMASSVISATATILGALWAYPAILLGDGTPVPQVAVGAVLSGVAVVLAARLREAA